MNIVTGAFSYTGKYIAARLLAMGEPVATLTGHPDRPDPFGGRVRAFPLAFREPGRLLESLRGAETLYNTYWVRFSHGETSHAEAVANTKVLLRAAEEAGVRRIVHISITGANAASTLPYFRGKGQAEQAIASSPLGHAIIRPTIVFGMEDILLNNIAWFLRRFPIFPMPGNGRYPVQPVYVEDLAGLAVAAGHREEDLVWDAAGPERMRFVDLVRLLRRYTGSRAAIAPAPPALALAMAKIMGSLVKDVVLTRDEVLGLMAGLLVSAEPPRGTTRLSEWLERNKGLLGRRYASEIKRHYRRDR